MARCCLAKEPSDRYATAGELADDLQRHLDGAPVRARVQGAAGRTWRAAVRHPATVALAVGVALGGAGALWWSIQQSGRADATQETIDVTQADLD